MRAPRPVGAPVLLLWIALLLVTPPPASSHAVVLESSPAPDAVLGQSPPAITLRFNSKLEKRFTRVTLAAGNQPPVAVALPEGGDAAAPDRLVIPIRSLGPGAYVLRYRVLAVDGHITEGALRFTVETAR